MILSIFVVAQYWYHPQCLLGQTVPSPEPHKRGWNINYARLIGKYCNSVFPRNRLVLIDHQEHEITFNNRAWFHVWSHSEMCPYMVILKQSIFIQPGTRQPRRAGQDNVLVLEERVATGPTCFPSRHVLVLEEWLPAQPWPGMASPAFPSRASLELNYLQAGRQTSSYVPLAAKTLKGKDVWNRAPQLCLCISGTLLGLWLRKLLENFWNAKPDFRKVLILCIGSNLQGGGVSLMAV